ncbi:MAG: 5-oxoprolinase/urea amidolyase family protein [Gulosibacter sp.]|uniref:5-oxoprolinase subunit B/C family protein n=1 Tax=Gulosibacter sp. TaxID=2817531 RepID=UPI003F938B76
MSADTVTPELALPFVRRAGDRGLLLDFGSLDDALHGFQALQHARAASRFEADELVPAAETVLIRGGDARHPEVLVRLLRDVLIAGQGADAAQAHHDDIVVPVVYDGVDLEEIAGLTGFSETEVISRHTEASYTVAFTGFAPGFAYLSGGDTALIVPRRSTPRHRIIAGSVGLADRFTGIYPRESPGGWQLLGHSTLPMWDLSRPDPALLKPGGTVRFEAVRDSATTATPLRTEHTTEVTSAPQDSQHAVAVLEIQQPGLMTIFQDFGRPNLANLGVSASGAADRTALVTANELVGNVRGATALELGAGTVSCRVVRDTVIALAGAPRRGTIKGPLGVRDVPHEQALRVNTGEILQLEPPERGVRTMLAVRGGIEAGTVLGSASRDTLAGLGPEPLAAGDRILANESSSQAVGFALPPSRQFAGVGETTTLRILLGPRDDWFDTAGLDTFWQTRWEVSPRSDRVGVRLVGASISRDEAHVDRELPSEGLATGAIQVPPDGQPVLFLADHPVTGGYPVIGSVCEADLDLAAQLPPGSFVKFERCETNDGLDELVDFNKDATQ